MTAPCEIDNTFQNAWLPFFCRSGWDAVDVDEFAFEVEAWLTRLSVCLLLMLRCLLFFIG